MRQLSVVSGFAVALAAACVLHAATITGKWNASRRSRTLVQLNLTLGKSNHGFQVKLAEIPDLQKAWEEKKIHARFTLSREAGAIIFSGVLTDDSGVGDFEFQPTGDFPAKMNALGYPGLTDKDQYQMTVPNLTTAYVRELNAAGYSNLSQKQLTEMRIFDVDSEFINGLSAHGYSNLPASRLVEMQIHGVSPELLVELKKVGFDQIPVRRLIEFRIHGVTPSFIQSVQDAGFPNVSSRELVEMRIHNVTPHFIEQARARERNPSIREIINMKITGSGRE